MTKKRARTRRKHAARPATAHTKRAHRRRKQLACRPSTAQTILDPPTLAAEGLLAALGMQRVGNLLVFPADRLGKPGLARAAIRQAAQLVTALEDVQGHRSAAQRKAEWHLGALGVYLEACIALAPHLPHTRQTDQPWRGCQDDLAALKASHPDWAPGIDSDAEYLGRLEQAIAHDDRMERRLRGLLAEGRELLQDYGHVAPDLAARLREAIEDLQDQIRTYAPPPIDLAVMPVAGSA